MELLFVYYLLLLNNLWLPYVYPYGYPNETPYGYPMSTPMVTLWLLLPLWLRYGYPYGKQLRRDKEKSLFMLNYLCFISFYIYLNFKIRNKVWKNFNWSAEIYVLS